MSLPNNFIQLESAYFVNCGCLNTLINLNSANENGINAKNLRVDIDARRDNFRAATLMVGCRYNRTTAGDRQNFEWGFLSSLYAIGGSVSPVLYPQRSYLTFTITDPYDIGDSFTWTSTSYRMVSCQIIEGESGTSGSTLVYRSVNGIYGIYDGTTKVGDINDNGDIVTIDSLPFASPFRIKIGIATDDCVVLRGGNIQGSGSWESHQGKTNSANVNSSWRGGSTTNNWRNDTANLRYPFDYSVHIDGLNEEFGYTVNNTTRLYAVDHGFDSTLTDNSYNVFNLLIGAYGGNGAGAPSYTGCHCAEIDPMGYNNSAGTWYVYRAPVITDDPTQNFNFISSIYSDTSTVAGTPFATTDSIRRVKIYLQVEGENDQLIKDYIPVMNTRTGEVCFYDQLNDELAYTYTPSLASDAGYVGEARTHDSFSLLSMRRFYVRDNDGLITIGSVYIKDNNNNLVPLPTAKIVN